MELFNFSNGEFVLYNLYNKKKTCYKQLIEYYITINYNYYYENIDTLYY